MNVCQPHSVTIRGATIHRYTGVPRFLGTRYTPRYVFANIVDCNFLRFSDFLSTVLAFRPPLPFIHLCLIEN